MLLYLRYFLCGPLSYRACVCVLIDVCVSLRSRRKQGRGRGRGARTREKNGGLGARDEGTPATKTPIFSFLRPPAAAKF